MILDISTRNNAIWPKKDITLFIYCLFWYIGEYSRSLYNRGKEHCNPDILEDKDKKKKKLSPPEYLPSVYIVDFSRSVYERGKYHRKSFRTKGEDSQK